MYLSNNQLTGHINEFFRDSLLDSIDLGNNKLQGPIPPSIFELQFLNVLTLSSNNLSGVVELHMFAKLENLNYLDLSFNSLSIITEKESNSFFP